MHTPAVVQFDEVSKDDDDFVDVGADLAAAGAAVVPSAGDGTAPATGTVRARQPAQRGDTVVPVAASCVT
jgi:hypothetical protein